jgi:EmrB/QacA subfamily drug resistance transporter
VAEILLASRTGRLVVTAAVLGSGMAMLDGTVVNVAIVRIGEDLDASLADLQWITNGYLLTLASLILLGGSLGDRLGRRRIFLVGVVWFAVASAGCGIAQNPTQLVLARLLQGVGGALLTPGSLSMIQASFRRDDRAKAIGAWSGFGGIAAAIGPFVGGWLVQYASWRWAFLINVPIAAVTVWVARAAVPETRDESAPPGTDLPGAVLGTLALAVSTFALIEHERLGAPLTAGLMVLGLAVGVAFALVERRHHDPMVPPSLFTDRQFTGANLATLLVYASMGAVFFFLSLQLQTVLGYGPLLAGIASLPITILMLLLAAQGGALAARIGPRLPMSLGPVVCAIGVALLSQVRAGSSYWTGVLPGVTVFGLGLCLLVAPLTATVLAAAPDRYAGIASGVNNAVARAGSLLAVAALPAVVGLAAADYRRPAVFSSAYASAMWVCTGLLLAGGVISWLLIQNVGLAAAPTPAETGVTGGSGPTQPRPAPVGWSCAGSAGCPGQSLTEPAQPRDPA